MTVPLAALALAGCGGSEVDRGKAEDFVRSYFSPPARSAHCPAGVTAKKGRTFACTAVDTAGRSFRVTVHVLDGDGRVRIATPDVVPAGG